MEHTVVSLQQQVREIVTLLMKRPITEEIAIQVGNTPGFEHLEIVDGQWVGFGEERTVGGEEHGWIEALLITMLTNWVLENQAGRIYPGDTDFVLDGTPDDIRIVRRPDVAFVANNRVKSSKAHIYGAPDLAIEIISPSERPSQIRQKLREYFQAHTKRVWQIYPDNQEIIVHFPDGTAKSYGISNTITDEELLPGFTLDVAKIFES